MVTAADHNVVIHSIHHAQHILRACASCGVYLTTVLQRNRCAKGFAILSIWILWTICCSYLMTLGWDELYYPSTTSTTTPTQQQQHHHHSSSKTKRTYLLIVETILCYVLLGVGLGVRYVLRYLLDSKRQRQRQQQRGQQQPEQQLHYRQPQPYDDCYEEEEEGHVLFVEEEDDDDDDNYDEELLSSRPRSFSLVLLCQEIDLVVLVDHSHWMWKRLTKRLMIALIIFGIYYRLLLVILEWTVMAVSSSSCSSSSSSSSQDHNTSLHQEGGLGYLTPRSDEDSHNDENGNSTSSSASCLDNTIVLVLLLGVYPLLILLGVQGIHYTWTTSRQRPSTTTSTSTSYAFGDRDHNEDQYYYLDGANNRMLWGREDDDNEDSIDRLLQEDDTRMSLL